MMSDLPSIGKIERYFEDHGIPDGPIALDKGTVIVDTKQFVFGHVTILRANKKKRRFLPYYNRLLKFYELCLKNQRTKTSH